MKLLALAIHILKFHHKQMQNLNSSTPGIALTTVIYESVELWKIILESICK